MLVPLWSLREVQDKLKVHPGHLSLGSTLARKGLQIDDVLKMQATKAARTPGWIDQAPEAVIPRDAHSFWLRPEDELATPTLARLTVRGIDFSMHGPLNDRRGRATQGLLHPPASAQFLQRDRKRLHVMW